MNTGKGNVHRFTVLLSGFFFGAGLFAPLFTITAATGPLGEALNMFAPGITEPKAYSLVASISNIFAAGNSIMGVMLVLFSIAMPVLKFAVLWVEASPSSGEYSKHITLLKGLFRYSMIELFLLAVMIVAVQGLPGGGKATLHVGVLLFAASIMLPMATESFGLFSSDSKAKIGHDNRG